MEAPLLGPADVAVLPPSPPAADLPAAPRVRPRELLGLLAICALADVCLWGRSGGAGHAALLAAVPAVLYATVAARRHTGRLQAVAALLLVLAVRLLWQSSAGAVALGAAGLVAFAVALRSKRSYVPELVVSGAASLVTAFRSVARMAIGATALARPGRLLREHRWVSVLAPIVVVVAFTLLFSAANPVVEEWMTALWSSVTGGHHSITPLRAIFWVCSALGAALLLEPALREPTWSERLGPGHALATTDAVPSATARATARNVLVAVNALFLVYNALDATYLWAGQLPPRIGYTEYAHRGALWLTISLAVSTLVLGVLFRGAMSFAAEARRTRILGYVWATQNLVLAAGTLRRISLYVDHSGLTRLLILGVLGSTLVCVGLGLIVLKLARRRTGLWLLRRQLDALAIGLVLFTVLPTEAISGWYNASRIEQREYRPLLHLFMQPLTAEGVPALASMLDNPNPVIRRGAAGLLLQQERRLAREQKRARSWTSWEWSRSDALGTIRRARPQIDAARAEASDADSVDTLRRLAMRCRSSVAKPIRCDPLPTTSGARPATPLRPVQLRPYRAGAEGAGAKPRSS